MLTCGICGEDTLLEEDMKTHLLLSHLENDMQCPLCSLSRVSYDDLCFHICSAHPGKQHNVDHFTSPTRKSATETEKAQTAPKLINTTSTSASGLTTDSVQCKHSHTPETGSSSVGEKPLITSLLTIQSTKARQDTVRHSNDDNNGIKAKQKKLSLPREEKLFSCPMCALVCSSAFILQEHVELHLQEELPAEGEKRFECPMCSVVCSDGFSLQEHVELHLDHGAAANPAGSPGCDLKLARHLQEEEEQRWKQEEAQKEREEFKKLQRQFGLDGRGGYCKQMERAMGKAVASGRMAPLEFHCKRAEMMESLASGVDDGTTRTCGVINVLYEYYQTECKDCVHVWLSADTDHYCSSAGDKGWGCGYRNFQMLLSSLHTIDTYATVLQGAQSHYLISDLESDLLPPRHLSFINLRQVWEHSLYC